MKHTDFCALARDIKRKEQEELRRALEAHGGSYSWWNRNTGEREILVSTTDLEVVLLEDIEGSIAAHDAIALDEVIAYYIEPEEVLLPEEEIVELIERAYAV